MPAPARTAGGTRQYGEHDLALLREVARMLDSGMRPAAAFSKIRLSQHLTEKELPPLHTNVYDRVEIMRLVNAVAEHRLEAVRQVLERAIYDRGIGNFIHTLAEPLMREIGIAWENGDLYVYGEHGLSALMQEVLARANADLAGRKQGIRILLATPPGEHHTLGLSMIEAVIRSAGGECIQMGGDLPLNELCKAAVAFEVDVVGVSFSAHTVGKKAEKYLLELQQAISGREIWIGGMGADTLQAIPPSMHTFENVYEVHRRVSRMVATRHHAYHEERVISL